MSGFASIAGELFQSESNIPDLLESEASLQAGLDQVCTSTKDGIMKVLRAVMGVPGSSEADIPWAMKMKDGEDTGYVHAISYLFGNGQWLLDHPTDGLTDIFDEFENHMVWQQPSWTFPAPVADISVEARHDLAASQAPTPRGDGHQRRQPMRRRQRDQR